MLLKISTNGLVVRFIRNVLRIKIELINQQYWVHRCVAHVFTNQKDPENVKYPPPIVLTFPLLTLQNYNSNRLRKIITRNFYKNIDKLDIV